MHYCHRKYHNRLSSIYVSNSPPISDPKLAAIGESAIITPTSNNESTLSFKYNAKRH